MTENEFEKRFPDEASCIAYLRQIRESEGNVCSQCGCTDYFYDKVSRSWRFKCGHVKTIRSGTIMQASRLSCKIWLKSIYLMSCENMMPANKFKEKIGINTPNHVRILQMRIRDAMSQYLKANGVRRVVGKDAEREINSIFNGIAEENRQYYICEYVFRHRPENVGDACFENLVKACVSYTTDVKLKR